jgi:hypothetical protein
MFSTAKKIINGPSLPPIPPQTHHKNTIVCHYNFAKTPAKSVAPAQQEKNERRRQIQVLPLTLLVWNPDLHRSRLPISPCIVRN